MVAVNKCTNHQMDIRLFNELISKDFVRTIYVSSEHQRALILGAPSCAPSMNLIQAIFLGFLFLCF